MIAWLLLEKTLISKKPDSDIMQYTKELLKSWLINIVITGHTETSLPLMNFNFISVF
jgi:hypothetical protein